MAVSEVQIANLALARIGVNRFIASLTEASIEAVTCSLCLATARDATLRDVAWAFADTWADLQLIEQDPNSEWGYAYREPSDCVRVRRVPLGGRRGDSAPFSLSSDSGGGLILTDQNPATIVYTRRIEDPSLFPADFVMALAWRLAVEIGPSLSQVAAIRDRADAGYRDALSKARVVDANEQVADPPPESSFIQARD